MRIVGGECAIVARAMDLQVLKAQTAARDAEVLKAYENAYTEAMAMKARVDDATDKVKAATPMRSLNPGMFAKMEGVPPPPRFAIMPRGGAFRVVRLICGCGCEIIGPLRFEGPVF